MAGLPRPSKPVPARKPAPVVRSTARYMTSFGGSPDPVCDFVNMRFLPCWGTTDFGQIADEIYRTLARGVRGVSLYVDWLMWDNSSGRYVYVGSELGKARLHELCFHLKEAGVLRYVKFWWMPDEPAKDKKIVEPDFRQCVLDMMAVSRVYPELDGVEFVAIWGDENDKRLAKDLIHGQGLDNYDRGAGLLYFYDEMQRDLRDDQWLLLVPAMYTGEHKLLVIEQFMQYMRDNPKVRMMCPFLYDVAQGGYSTDAKLAARVMAVTKEVTGKVYVPPSVPAPVPTASVPPAPSADDVNAPYLNAGAGQQG